MRKNPSILLSVAILALVNSQVWAFNCTKAFLPVDFVICSNSQVMQANEAHEKAWFATRANLNEIQKKILLDNQREWLKYYPPKCGIHEKGKAPTTILPESQQCVIKELLLRTEFLKNYLQSLDANKKQQIEADSFDQYAVPVYVGRPAKPDFESLPNSRTYRTRIRDGIKQGVNFAGHYAIVFLGCGMGCRSFYLVDVKSGKIFDFPLGGEEQFMLYLDFHPNSKLIKASWESVGSSGDHTCFRQKIVLMGTTLKFLHNAKIDGHGYCDNQYIKDEISTSLIQPKSEKTIQTISPEIKELPPVNLTFANEKQKTEIIRAVLDSLKDPDSAKFGQAILVDNKGACIEVNAKNSYGGYTGKQSASVINISGLGWQSVGIYNTSLSFCANVLHTTLHSQ